ncbi:MULTISPECIES: glucosaminidase domain-containing protein [unclassified Sulfurospirillum]|uniref:glucosaminidase domain-containing protein n=1 Tax=unclassified Sulfurospirillum TaxID=2618290 RepID=UPI0005075719|nr:MULTISPECIES: glucosaminidase domain-containing protein [unclassified Sulfurospirillum]KFL33258.1 mannosyl-glycoprotein endo-beta-N-acetylglucosamidase [Sulfurospirillum sp. SCADC]
MKVFSSFLIASCLLLQSVLHSGGLSSEYYQIEDNAKQKEEFIRQMKILVDRSNEEIRKEREFITNFFAKAMPDAFRGLNQQNVGYLISLRNKYGIESLFDRDEYFKRIDVIPTSLALAQASLESGWGKSRFAREANNLFGHWTYSGVGLMPQNRMIGKTHMIRIFGSLQKSVNAYMLNLNTNDAYSLFRERRLIARNSGKAYTGIDAAKTMVNYSELKEEYNKMIKEMIEQNNLLIYDK